MLEKGGKYGISRNDISFGIFWFFLNIFHVINITWILKKIAIHKISHKFFKNVFQVIKIIVNKFKNIFQVIKNWGVFV